MDEQIERLIKSALEEQFLKGLSQGAKAMCGTIRDIAARKNLSDMQKLEAVLAFCEKSLRLSAPGEERRKHE